MRSRVVRVLCTACLPYVRFTHGGALHIRSPFMDLRDVNLAVRVASRSLALRHLKLRVLPAAELQAVPIATANRVCGGGCMM